MIASSSSTSRTVGRGPRRTMLAPARCPRPRRDTRGSPRPTSRCCRARDRHRPIYVTCTTTPAAAISRVVIARAVELDVGRSDRHVVAVLRAARPPATPARGRGCRRAAARPWWSAGPGWLRLREGTWPTGGLAGRSRWGRRGVTALGGLRAVGRGLPPSVAASSVVSVLRRGVPALARVAGAARVVRRARGVLPAVDHLDRAPGEAGSAAAVAAARHARARRGGCGREGTSRSRSGAGASSVLLRVHGVGRGVVEPEESVRRPGRRSRPDGSAGVPPGCPRRRPSSRGRRAGLAVPGGLEGRGTPRSTSASATAWARSSESCWLKASSLIESVCPPICSVGAPVSASAAARESRVCSDSGRRSLLPKSKSAASESVMVVPHDVIGSMVPIGGNTPIAGTGGSGSAGTGTPLTVAVPWPSFWMVTEPSEYEAGAVAVVGDGHAVCPREHPAAVAVVGDGARSVGPGAGAVAVDREGDGRVGVHARRRRRSWPPTRRRSRSTPPTRRRRR